MPEPRTQDWQGNSQTPSYTSVDNSKTFVEHKETFIEAAGEMFKKVLQVTVVVGVVGFIFYGGTRWQDFVARPTYKAQDFVSDGGLNQLQAKKFVEHINACLSEHGTPGLCSEIVGPSVGGQETAYRRKDYPPEGNG